MAQLMKMISCVCASFAAAGVAEPQGFMQVSAGQAEHIITVNSLGGESVEFLVVAGQTVRDFKSRADFRATLGPQCRARLINNRDGDHVLQDDELLDGVTDVTAIMNVTVDRDELRHTIEENNMNLFEVAGMGEDIFIRKAPDGERTGNEARPQDVPLYRMFNRNNENLVLAEFGSSRGDVYVGSYFYTWPENWTSENVGPVAFGLWEEYIGTIAKACILEEGNPKPYFFLI